jgi:hypothetical protein
MKNKLFFLVLSVVALLFISCDESVTPIQPSGISNITSEARSGEIFLQWEWDIKHDENVELLRITYFDHLLGRDALRVASVYSDTILIPNTRAKFGEYTFTFQPVSSTGTLGSTQQIKAVSGVAPATTIRRDERISLTAAMLSTNAQEPSEGPIANLVDRNPDTFFHTAWSVAVGSMHYFQVALPEPVSGLIRYDFNTRHSGNGGGDPQVIRVEGSNNGTNWTEIVVHDFRPDGQGTTYANTRRLLVESPLMNLQEAYSMFRFTPLARRSQDPLNSSFFDLGQFAMFEVDLTIIDPEAP